MEEAGPPGTGGGAALPTWVSGWLGTEGAGLRGQPVSGYALPGHPSARCRLGCSPRVMTAGSICRPDGHRAVHTGLEEGAPGARNTSEGAAQAGLRRSGGSGQRAGGSRRAAGQGRTAPGAVEAAAQGALGGGASEHPFQGLVLHFLGCLPRCSVPAQGAWPGASRSPMLLTQSTPSSWSPFQSEGASAYRVCGMWSTVADPWGAAVYTSPLAGACECHYVHGMATERRGDRAACAAEAGTL